jgi:hypothetical protein
MPAIKCNGKWKWGQRGKCVYETKRQALRAGRAIKAQQANMRIK